MEYGLPEDVAPLLTEEKWKFVKIRWLCTCLGGMRLMFEEKQPIFLYLMQILMFLVPPLTGIILFSITTVSSTFAIAFGIFMAIWTAGIHTFVSYIRHKFHHTITTAASATTCLESDDLNFQSTSILDQKVVDFIFPHRSIKESICSITLSAVISSLTAIACSIIEKETTTMATIALWYLYATAQYPLTGNSPVEFGAWNVNSHSLISNTLHRSTYLILILAPVTLFSTATSAIILLSVLINVGAVPRIDIFLTYILEQVLGFLFGFYTHSLKVQIATLSILTVITAISAYSSSSNSTPMIIVATSVYAFIVSCGYIDRFLLYSTCIKLSSTKSTTVSPVLLEEEALSTKKNVPPLLLWKSLQESNYSLTLSAVSNLQQLGRILFTTTLLILLCTVFNSQLIIISPKILAVIASICSLVLTILKRWWYNSPRRRIGGGGGVTIIFFLILLVQLPIIYQIFLQQVVAEENYLKLFLYICSAFRIFQKCFSHPETSSFELLLTLLISESSSTTLPIIMTLMIVGFSTSRVKSAALKLSWVWIQCYSLVCDKKLRFRGWALVPLLLSPLSCLSFVVSVILDAPLSSFCGTTVFIVGFPRPKCFWSSLKASSSGSESIYYQQILPHIIRQVPILRQVVTESNQILLLRFEKMIVTINFISTGFRSCTFRMKGLELQEPTSCHNKEANAVDAVLLESKPCSHSNSSILTPLTSVIIPSYSISEISLTGILDSKENLKLIAKCFWYTLVWTLHHEGYEEENSVSSVVPHDLLQDLLEHNFPNTWYNELLQNQFTSPPPPAKVLVQSPNNNTVVAAVDTSLPYNGDIQAAMRANDRNAIRTIMNHSQSTSTPADRKEESWDEIPDIKDYCETEVLSNSSKESQCSMATKTTAKTKMNVEELDDFCDDDTAHLDDFHVTGTSATKKKKTLLKSIIPQPPPVTTARPPSKASATFKRQKPIKVDKNAAFPNLVSTCYSIVQILGNNYQTKASEVVGSKSHVYNCYHGDFPPCIELESLVANNRLKASVIKSYRLALKLALDHIILDNTDDEFLTYHEELNSELKEIDGNWHLGSLPATKTKSVWEEQIRKERRHLFSLSKNSSSLRSTVLTLQPNSVANVGSLNYEGCKGTWASLITELLYMTNDDDERYSIQANPKTFRNLLVQMADAPFGYPVFTTGSIHLMY